MLTKDIEKNFPYISVVTYGGNEYVGIIANQDQYGFDTVTTEGVDPSNTSSNDMGIGFKTGGLLNKKKPKPKRMKRGGLASKK